AGVPPDPDDTLRRYLEQFERPVTADEPAVAPDADAIAAPRDTPAWPPGRVLQGRFGAPALLILVGLTAALLAARSARGAQAEATRHADAPAVSSAGFAPAPAV